jgi:hypothetical protein
MFCMLRNGEYTLTVDSNKIITRSFLYFLLLHILYLQSQIRWQITNMKGKTCIGIRPINSCLYFVNRSSTYVISYLWLVEVDSLFVGCIARKYFKSSSTREFWTYIVKSQIKSSMKKCLDCDHNKLSIFLVICNTYIP